LDDRIKANGPAGEQPTHGPGSFWAATVGEWFIPLTVASPVIGGGIALSLWTLSSRATTIPRLGALFAVPTALGLGTAYFLHHRAMQVEEPSEKAAQLTPNEVIVPEIVEGDTSRVGDEVGSATGYTGEGPKKTGPLTLGAQIGRTAGYSTIDEAIAGASGQGHAAVVQEGSTYYAYGLETNGEAKAILGYGSPDIESNDDSVVAIVRDSAEVYRRSHNGKTLALVGNIKGMETGKVVADKRSVIDELSGETVTSDGDSYALIDSDRPVSSAEHAVWDVEGQYREAGESDRYVRGGEIRGPSYGYPALDDATGAAMLLSGNQGVVRDGETGQYVVFDIDGDEKQGRLLGITTDDENFKAMEYKGRLFTNAGGRFVSASFDGTPN
jgi:hypothetical protein